MAIFEVLTLNANFVHIPFEAAVFNSSKNLRTRNGSISQAIEKFQHVDKFCDQ